MSGRIFAAARWGRCAADCKGERGGGDGEAACRLERSGGRKRRPNAALIPKLRWQHLL